MALKPSGMTTHSTLDMGKTSARRMADIRSAKKYSSANPLNTLSATSQKSAKTDHSISPTNLSVRVPEDVPERNVAEVAETSQIHPDSRVFSEGIVPPSSADISGDCPARSERIRDRLVSIWFSWASAISGPLRVFGSRRVFGAGVASLLLCAGAWYGAGIFRKGVEMKGKVLGVSTDGYESLSRAIETAKSRDFVASGASFRDAFHSFSAASEWIGEWNGTLVEATRFLPVLSQVSSGKYLVDAARDIAAAGEKLSTVGEAASSLGNPLAGSANSSFLETFHSIRGDLVDAERLLSRAVLSIEKVSIEDLPPEKRETFLLLATKLPEMASGLRLFLDHGDIFSDIVGGNGPRKFLFLFQNNQEMRATGGFIGSYAFLDIVNGKVRTFFVDGIFNPDGQIHEDIVPPLPLQKVSAGWSLHDSNWFPDFPLSAEKAIHFYEKTGGPTVDGVVAFTPEVLRRLLSITGPILLEKYGVTLNEENFLSSIQYQVEVAYDKKENRPKQILADLAPILLDRVFGENAPPGAFEKALSSIEAELSEKHILIYSRNTDMQRLISEAGWSGEVLSSRRDYASVIHSNINGYKTDGVIDEHIAHRAEIREDGSVVDTLVVRRTHRGGTTGYEWWDKVNADYLRVYVPRGATLLSVEGQTRESVKPPLNYDALQFSRDPDILREERGTKIDPGSGTRVSEDAGKTVFGNWVYVSPGESVEVRYTYLLPFRVDCVDESGICDPYSVVFQKQSGSRGSRLSSEIVFPKARRPIWQSAENLIPFDGGFRLETDLVYDRFVGVLLSK